MSGLPHVFLAGAAGHLGSHLAPALVEAGFEVTGIDVLEPTQPQPRRWRFVAADLLRREEYKDFLREADLVVHCASIHPWKPYSDDQYLENNIRGTWHLYTLAAELGIGKIVLTSSIAATGYRGIRPEDWPVTEDRQFPLEDIYGLTKRTQEEIAGVFAQQGKIRTLALRPPAFMPKDELETGFMLTGAYAVVHDVVSAHVAAVRVLAGLQKPGEPVGDFEAIFVTNALPYTSEDALLLARDGNVKPLVKMRWLEAYDWLEQKGFEGGWLPALYDLSKAKRILDWTPRRNFDQWYAEHGGK